MGIWLVGLIGKYTADLPMYIILLESPEYSEPHCCLRTYADQLD